jgi:hypothetical protein
MLGAGFTNVIFTKKILYGKKESGLKRKYFASTQNICDWFIRGFILLQNERELLSYPQRASENN